MKALVGAFNQEKALVGAFSMIVKTGCETDGSICGTSIVCGLGAQVPAAAPILPIKIRGPDWAVFWRPAVVSTSKHQIGRMQLSQQKLSCGQREIWFRQSHNSHCKMFYNTKTKRRSIVCRERDEQHGNMVRRLWPGN